MPLTDELRRAGGVKSGETRRQAALELATLKALVTPKLVHAPLEVIPELETITTIELARLRSRLDTLDELMKKAKTDREWDNLSRAYERVFRAWVHLAGIPGPGQLKPVTPRTPKHSQAEPIE